MLPNPRRTPTFWLHRNHLAQAVDIRKSLGLEIGAMDLPLVEPGEGTCEFADSRTFEELRQLADRLGGHNPDFVVPIDYEIQLGYQVITKHYDWIAAAHVVEHVPNLVWWFNELYSKLKDGGVLFLVVPDKRFTFDYHRRVTNLSDVISANQQQLRRPSYKQVFDHYFFATAQLDPGDIWNGVQVGPPQKDYAAAVARAKSALTSFEDAHCSVFTPTSFSELMNDLSRTGLLKFRLEGMRATQRNQLDFTAVFRKLEGHS